MRALTRSVSGLAHAIKREWMLYHLADQRFRFMWDAAPEQEWVSLDCETTGLDRRRDEIIAIAAVRIEGNRVMTSQRLELLVRPQARRLTADTVRVHRLRERDVAEGVEAEEAATRLMHFVGSRPLVGYYLEFDVAMINGVIYPMLGLRLPQRKIEVSSLYHAWRSKRLGPYQEGATIDLRFDTIMKQLDLPSWEAHDALNDAVMAALAFVKLRGLLGE